MIQLIGRQREMSELERCQLSNRSEFVVVYGRRRIGKTFLIRSFFHDKFDFFFTGLHNYKRQPQLDDFAVALQKYGGSKFKIKLDSWNEAFNQLQVLLSKKRSKSKKIVFIDEMPWIDTRRSDFVPALEKFWNSWASLRDDIMLIVCGSSTSWIIDNIIKNQGGLYNRVTMQIYLRPFTLAESRQYLIANGCKWDIYQVAQCYMVMGGVPFYYSLLDNSQSLAQNIDRLFFSSKNAVLRTEFEQLFATLFNKYDRYINVIKVLIQRQEGFTRSELAELAGFGGSELTKILENLERCDFIQGFDKFNGGVKNRIYKVCDLYTLFYFKFIYNKSAQPSNYWQKIFDKPSIAAWQGFTFETICLMHTEQIKRALGIEGILTSTGTWRSKNRDAQIDLVIERSDRTINLCEIKFSKNKYVITSEYENRLRDRESLFIEETKTKYAVNTVFITTYGVRNPQNFSIVCGDLKLDDLFL